MIAAVIQKARDCDDVTEAQGEEDGTMWHRSCGEGFSEEAAAVPHRGHSGENEQAVPR